MLEYNDLDGLYQLSTINYQLSTIHYPLSTIHCQLSTVNYPLSTIHCQLSTIHYQLLMASLPQYRPRKVSLGPLETEILHLVWELKKATVKDVHDRILADPDRELAYTSVTTVLRRLTEKGWLACSKIGRAFSWEPLISRQEAEAMQAYDRLHNFLAVSNPDLVASFADSLDTASIEQIEAIAQRLQAVRRQRGEQK